jgi:hypothetical protein
MTTANLRIVPDDWRDATLTTSITEQTGFEAANTQNDIRGDVYKTADTTSVDISATWSASRTASALMLFNHLLHGANFRLRLYSDAAWSSGVYDSTATAALCYTTTSDAYTWATGTKDRLKARSPSWLYFTETAYQSAKLTLSGTPSAVAYFQLGTVILGRYFEAAINPAYGMQIGGGTTGRSTRTDAGSKRGYQGAYYPTFTCSLEDINENERAFWVDFMEDVGTTTYFGYSGFPGDGTTLERDHTGCGTCSSIDAIGRKINRLEKRLQIEGS